MKTHVFEADQILSAPIDRVFEFFSDAPNLETITPASLKFEILSPLPIEMHEGTFIHYRLALHGMPMKWLSRIEEWKPGRSFVDRQLRGPYALWVHRHVFEPHARGTYVYDHVEYALPFDPLSRPLHSLFVRPQIERIFAYRRGILAQTFGEPNIIPLPRVS
jgi:ligand-binding SRPBCC domain-containing protein